VSAAAGRFRVADHPGPRHRGQWRAPRHAPALPYLGHPCPRM